MLVAGRGGLGGPDRVQRGEVVGVGEGLVAGLGCGPPTRYGIPISPGGAHRRPRSARTRRLSPAPGAAPAARSCGPARRGWSSRKPGPGWPPPNSSAPAPPPPSAPRRPQPAPCAAGPVPSVIADEESFTAGLHHAIWSMTSTQVTASSLLQALTAAADAAARDCLHTLSLPGRQRHSKRAQKHGRNSRTPPPR